MIMWHGSAIKASLGRVLPPGAVQTYNKRGSI